MAVSNVVMKVFYVNEHEEVKQEIIPSPSKRAVTKKMETAGYEVLKQVDVTDEYRFTIDEVIKGTLNEKQKMFLTYLLTEMGVDKNASTTEEK